MFFPFPNENQEVVNQHRYIDQCGNYSGVYHSPSSLMIPWPGPKFTEFSEHSVEDNDNGIKIRFFNSSHSKGFIVSVTK